LVKINHSILTLNDSAKYLGFKIDTKLNFYNHIKTIEHKLSLGLLESSVN